MYVTNMLQTDYKTTRNQINQLRLECESYIPCKKPKHTVTDTEISNQNLSARLVGYTTIRAKTPLSQAKQKGGKFNFRPLAYIGDFKIIVLCFLNSSCCCLSVIVIKIASASCLKFVSEWQSLNISSVNNSVSSEALNSQL